jgi:hypothetical protein
MEHDAASWRVDDGNQAYAHGDAHAPDSSPRAGFDGNLPAGDGGDGCNGDGAFSRRQEDLSAPSPRRSRSRVPVPAPAPLPLTLALPMQLPDAFGPENIRFRDGAEALG